MQAKLSVKKFFNLSEKAELLYGIEWEWWRKNRARPPISADKNMQNFASQDNNYHSSSSLSVVVLFVSLSWNLILNTIIVSPVVLYVKSSKEFDFEKGCCKLSVSLYISLPTLFPLKLSLASLNFASRLHESTAELRDVKFKIQDDEMTLSGQRWGRDKVINFRLLCSSDTGGAVSMY